MDFPPFGKSDQPHKNWDLNSYARLVTEVLSYFSIKETNVIGHSFGGRVGIVLASQTNTVKRLVLISSAGIKPRRNIFYHIKRLAYYRAKAKGRPLEKYYSADYKAMPDELKGVFSRIVCEDLSEKLKKIFCPVLVFSGNRDKETPMYMAKKINKIIPNSRLVRLNGDHFVFLREKLLIANEIDNFLEG